MFGQGGAGNATLNRMQRDLNRGLTAPGTTIAQMLEWIDGSHELKNALMEKYGEDEFDELRAFAQLQSDLLMAEIRQMQVNQLRGETVPVSVVTDLRDLTVSLLQDILGPAFIAQLLAYGVPEQLARRPRESALRGLQSLYAEYGQKLMNDAT